MKTDPKIKSFESVLVQQKKIEHRLAQNSIFFGAILFCNFVQGYQKPRRESPPIKKKTNVIAAVPLGGHINHYIKRVYVRFFFSFLKSRDMSISNLGCQKNRFLTFYPNDVKSSGGSNGTTFRSIRRLNSIEKSIFMFLIFFIFLFF